MVRTTSKRPTSSKKPSQTTERSSTLASPTPAASSSGSSQKVFPKFQKKVNTSTPASTTSSTVEPEKSLPVDTLDNSRPLQWRLGEPLTPMKPLSFQFSSHTERSASGTSVTSSRSDVAIWSISTHPLPCGALPSRKTANRRKGELVAIDAEIDLDEELPPPI
ncbi:hypothetical protein BS47DRAFT_1400361 [Hydnum rufescens UP504]|uniref:Uncharacterized protein n=1 Tax=Hydnum rufescens UP504 TaxID=1448309 RepID=A0A9P6AGU3_9AGAM|nr:hypothetical protein BS47DRAFT_1400361 [Hydnum rufescens UP504]